MKLSKLHITKLLQPRGGELDKDTVREYAASAKAGAKFPPLVAYKVTDRKFPGVALVAGFHRHAAYSEAGIEEAEVEVKEGTFAEAWLAGYQSNTTNGLRYTNTEKRAATEQALMLFKSLSARAIAVMLSVTHPFVQKVREELESIGKLEPSVKVVGRDGRLQITDKDKSQVETVTTCVEPRLECGDESEQVEGLFAERKLKQVIIENGVEIGEVIDDGTHLLDSGAYAESRKAIEDEPEPQILSTPRGEFVIDPYGRHVPNGVGDYFGSTAWQDIIDDAEGIVAMIEGLRERIQATARTPWLWIESTKIVNKSQELRNDIIKHVIDPIRAGLPHALCAHCNGKKCNHCRNSGYVPKSETQIEPELYAGHARKAG